MVLHACSTGGWVGTAVVAPLPMYLSAIFSHLSIIYYLCSFPLARHSSLSLEILLSSRLQSFRNPAHALHAVFDIIGPCLPPAPIPLANRMKVSAHFHYIAETITGKKKS